MFGVKAFEKSFNHNIWNNYPGIIGGIGSSNSPKTSSTTTTVESSSQSSEDRGPNPNNQVVNLPVTFTAKSGNQYTFNSIGKVPRSSTYLPRSNKFILTVDLIFTNNTSKTVSVYDVLVDDMKAQNPGTRAFSHEYPITMKNVENQELVHAVDTKIAPGDSIEVIVGFDLLYKDDDVIFTIESSQKYSYPQGFTWKNENF